MMITRRISSPFIPSKLSKSIFSSTQSSARYLHARLASHQPPIPSPTPFVPDPATFLTLIGRNLSTHSAKIPNWDSLFSLTSTQLRVLGVEPARSRRYLLWWRDRYRKGVFGIGGELKNVKDGEAEVRVVEMPAFRSEARASNTNKGAVKAEALFPKMRTMVVNEPPEALEKIVSAEGLKAVKGMTIRGARTIVGPFIQLVKGTKGSVARIKVQEGLWEVKRGEKIDGGERRKVMVRRKRLLEERKTRRD